MPGIGIYMPEIRTQETLMPGREILTLEILMQERGIHMLGTHMLDHPQSSMMKGELKIYVQGFMDKVLYYLMIVHVID